MTQINFRARFVHPSAKRVVSLASLICLGLLAVPASASILEWRQANFGITANTGSAADTADPDGDGVANRIEYALGSDPTSASLASLHIGAIEGGQFVFRFARSLDSGDATPAVQRSTDLVAWTTLATAIESATTVTEAHVASLTPSLPKEFMRLNVDGVTGGAGVAAFERVKGSEQIAGQCHGRRYAGAKRSCN